MTTETITTITRAEGIATWSTEAVHRADLLARIRGLGEARVIFLGEAESADGRGYGIRAAARGGAIIGRWSYAAAHELLRLARD